MLRSGGRLLAILLCGGLLRIAFPLPFASAQSGDEGAPWRLPAKEEPDLPLPEPLDINGATLDDLMSIPGLNPADAQAILNFRKAHRSISSLVQLKTSGIINDDIYDLIRPYIQVIDEDEEWHYRLLAGLAADDHPGPAIAKSPHRDRLKLKFDNAGSLSFGFALEKDAGETDLWDHTAMGLTYRFPRQYGKFILGDFLVGYGFGMLLNTRRNFFYAQQIEASLNPRHQGISAYQGWDENIALRGMAIQADLGRWSLAAWASHRRRDAFTDSLGIVTAFDLSGQHRTAAEQAREGLCAEDLSGGRIQFSLWRDRLHVACTGYQVCWDHTVKVGSLLYDQIAAGALELNAHVKPLSAVVELASNEHGETASMLGLFAKMSGILAQGALYRVNAQYFSPLSSALDFDLGQVRNRQGSFASVQAGIGETRVVGAMHLYRRLTKPVGESWGGQDLLAQLWRGFGQSVEATISSRWTQEEETSGTSQTSHWRGSGSLHIRPSRDWEMQSLLKLARTHETAGQGRLLQLGFGRNLALDARWTIAGNITTGIYSAPNYSLGLYWSDIRLDGSWQSHVFWGRGAFLALGIRGGLSDLWRFEIFSLWDQPESDSSRSSERRLWLTLRTQR